MMLVDVPYNYGPHLDRRAGKIEQAKQLLLDVESELVLVRDREVLRKLQQARQLLEEVQRG